MKIEVPQHIQDKAREDIAAFKEAKALCRAEMRKEFDEMEKRARAKKVFLDNCVAVPTPKELYAIWLLVWMNQGNKIRHYPSSAMSTMHFKTPTKFSDTAIPFGKGANDLKLVVVSNSKGELPIALFREHHDMEWMNSPVTVHTLRVKESQSILTQNYLSGLEAWTNRTDTVSCYSDIIDYLTGGVELVIGHDLLSAHTEKVHTTL